MTVAYELDFETYRPRLYVLPRPAGVGPHLPGRCRRCGWSVGAVAVISCSSSSHRRSGPSWGATAQAAPAQGQDYVVKVGDTLTSIATRADPARATSLTGQLALRDGDQPGRARGAYIFIPRDYRLAGVRCPWCGVDDDRAVWIHARPKRAGPSADAVNASAASASLHHVRAGRRGPAVGRRGAAACESLFDLPRSSRASRSACKNRPVSSEQSGRSWPRPWRTVQAGDHGADQPAGRGRRPRPPAGPR